MAIVRAKLTGGIPITSEIAVVSCRIFVYFLFFSLLWMTVGFIFLDFSLDLVDLNLIMALAISIVTLCWVTLHQNALRLSSSAKNTVELNIENNYRNCVKLCSDQLVHHHEVNGRERP